MDTPVLPVPGVDFAEYVAARRPTLMRAACAIAGDRNTAEDLLQTALASVFVRWAGIRDHRAADAYVRRAMANQHASWYRQKWRRNEQPTDAPPEPSAHQDSAGTEDTETDRIHLWSLVMALPPRQRSAVLLRYYEELSEAETADVLHCSVGTVKSSTSRGIATLRRLARESELPALAG